MVDGWMAPCRLRLNLSLSEFDFRTYAACLAVLSRDSTSSLLPRPAGCISETCSKRVSKAFENRSSDAAGGRAPLAARPPVFFVVMHRRQAASGAILKHFLRHTLITNPARVDVIPKQAQDFARHSGINLTMNRYSHMLIGKRVTVESRLEDIWSDLRVYPGEVGEWLKPTVC